VVVAAWFLWWHNVQYGDMATWFGAIATFAALVVALWVAVASYRGGVRERTDRVREQAEAEKARVEAERRHQASLVYIEVERTSWVKFDSGREDEITTIRLNERMVELLVDVTVRNRSDLPVFTVMPRLTPAPLHGVLPFDRVQGLNHCTNRLWYDPDAIVGKGLVLRATVDFMDVNERWWSRADNGVLTELERSPWPGG
jgi:hypothetical protein